MACYCIWQGTQKQRWSSPAFHRPAGLLSGFTSDNGSLARYLQLLHAYEFIKFDKIH
jgi:hypothetical protein